MSHKGRQNSPPSAKNWYTNGILWLIRDGCSTQQTSPVRGARPEYEKNRICTAMAAACIFALTSPAPKDGSTGSRLTERGTIWGGIDPSPAAVRRPGLRLRKRWRNLTCVMLAINRSKLATVSGGAVETFRRKRRRNWFFYQNPITIS